MTERKSREATIDQKINLRAALIELWDDGYKAGMLRAAEICEAQKADWAEASAWESHHAASDCAAAIRDEAK